MLMTQFAMMDPGPAGDSWLCRCCRAISQFLGFGLSPQEIDADRREIRGAVTLPEIPAAATPLHIVRGYEVEPTPILSHKWRRHEQLLYRPTSALPADERQARHHAVRGLYAARSGALEAAEDSFTKALTCPDIDLCDIPGFWSLNRTAMLTAVRAYESTGRLREASALDARIRNRFRPRVLTPVPENVMEIPRRRRLSLSSNS